MHDRADLNLFRVLDAVFTHGNTTRAAKSMHLSQPAISHALGRLRDLLDDPLFVREGSRMVPTPLTRNVIDTVRTSLAGLTSTLQQRATFEPASARRHFRVGSRDVLESLMLPRLLGQLCADAPGITVSSLRVAPGQLEPELTRGAMDLAIDVAAPVGERIHHEKVCDETLTVVMRRDHPARDALDLDAYLAFDHVLVTLEREGPELVDFFLSQEGLARSIRLRCQHYFAACTVIAKTDMLTTMPATYARILATVLPLTLVELPLSVSSLDVQVYWHERSDADPANRWLRSTLVSLVRDEVDRDPRPPRARAQRKATKRKTTKRRASKSKAAKP